MRRYEISAMKMKCCTKANPSAAEAGMYFPQWLAVDALVLSVARSLVALYWLCEINRPQFADKKDFNCTCVVSLSVIDIWYNGIFVLTQNNSVRTWWRHQMETFSALLAICAGNSPVPGEFPAQRPVTRNFDVFFDLRPNKRLSKQS